MGNFGWQTWVIKRQKRINWVEPGQNYGWNLKEASYCFEDMPCDTTQWVGLSDPVYEYLRDVGESITGGYVYRGVRYPELEGKYIYGDFDFRHVWALQVDSSGSTSNELLGTIFGRPSSFGEDEAGEIYVVDFNGPIWTFQGEASTSADPGEFVSGEFSLMQNFPNPFESETRITFELQSAGTASLNVYDVLGRRVRTLTSRHFSAGEYEFFWDGNDDAGNVVAGGVYIYSLEIADKRLNRAMVFLR